MNRIVVISGGFDPLHKGHIQYITDAKRLAEEGDNKGILVVGLNSDEWLRRKKGQEFMSFEDRHAIVSALGAVDRAIMFNDDDGTAIDAIERTASWASKMYPRAEIIFANGGDRSSAAATPESQYCEDNGFRCVYGVGGEDKANSSSWILEKWNSRENGDQR